MPPTSGSSKTVITTTKGRVRTLTLNRPEVRNALNGALVTALGAALIAADADPSVGAIVLTGAGTAFCSGADLKEIRPTSAFEAASRVRGSMDLHELLPKLSKPVIAAVNGPALAGGCGLALACDVVVSSSEAQFGYPEVQRGLVAALVMVNLARLVGRRKALELLLTGRRVSAQEAVEIGMANEVVPSTELMVRTTSWAEELANRSASAMAWTKRLYYRVGEIPFGMALRQARDVNLLMRKSSDAVRGATEFLAEKQRPDEEA